MKILHPIPPANTRNPASGASAYSNISRAHFATPGRLLRLNYAIDMRYGVLHDIATKILGEKPIDVRLGHVNFIWQGDASAQAHRCLAPLDTATSPINVSGPATLG